MSVELAGVVVVALSVLALAAGGVLLIATAVTAHAVNRTDPADTVRRERLRRRIGAVLACCTGLRGLALLLAVALVVLGVAL